MQLRVRNVRVSLATLVCLFASMLTIAVSCTPQAHAIDYYVSTKGSDSNSGSKSFPFRTIQHAADVVNAGDIVHVLPGTYAEAVEIKTSGNSSNRIRFISDSQWAATVTGNGTVNYSFMVRQANYIDIVGFEVTNKTGYQGIELYASYGRALGNHVHNVWAHGCTDWLGGAGINSSNYYGTGNQIIGNLVHDIGRLCTRMCFRARHLYC